MKVLFRLKYSTKFGENIFIRIDSIDEEIKDSKIVPLKYLDDLTWEVELDIAQKSISYTYLIKDDIKESSKIEYTNHQLYLPKAKSKIIVTDEWLGLNLPECYLNSKFFDYTTKKPTIESIRITLKDTHFFSIRTRLFNPDESIYIIGKPKSLGEWNPTQAHKMQWNGEFFFLSLNLTNFETTFEYKYLVKNHKSNKVIYFEQGSNRIAFPTRNNEFRVYNNTNFVIPSDYRWKGSGIAIPIFSLRSKEGLGVGEFADLIKFGDWCKSAGFAMIQILPINDTIANNDWRDSYPYAAISVYALHPIYIRLQNLSYKFKAFDYNEIKSIAKDLNQLESIDYESVIRHKLKYLRISFEENFDSIILNTQFNQFHDTNRDWIQPYALYSFLRDRYKTSDFKEWKTYQSFDNLDIQSLFMSTSDDFQDLLFYVYIQWQLHLQLEMAIESLHLNGITLKGDLPIGINRKSVDAWSHPELFHMDQQAGAPPDDFAKLGQNWEFPTYNWEAMKQRDYAWWKSRFAFMSNYFDAFRIDHILGFFRIWQIHIDSTQGILGRFEPAIPITINQLYENGITISPARLISPYITNELLKSYFGSEKNVIINKYFYECQDCGEYAFKEAYNSQRKIIKKLSSDHPHINKLLELSGNVLFIKENTKELKLHPRFAIDETSNYKQLDPETQKKILKLYNAYFYESQEEIWKDEAMSKLPNLKQATNMLACAEDLGMVPSIVKNVLEELGILSLKVQRMPNEQKDRFFEPKNAPYLSVVSPSSHDTSTLRQWWKEDRENTQYFYNTILKREGKAPKELTIEILQEIIMQHLRSTAMLSVIPLQEFLSLDDKLQNPNVNIERINNPAKFPHYWRYRMHITIDELSANTPFCQKLYNMHLTPNRI